MSEQPQIDKPNDPLAEQQSRKIDLEIKNLENQLKWDNRVAKFLPFITTLIAIGGFWLTFSQSQEAQRKETEQQDKERINRVQNQIRLNKEQLLEYLASDQTSTTRAMFVLDDLSALIEQMPAKEIELKKITGTLVDTVWELPFDKKRDIYFEAQLLNRWPPYRAHWKSDPTAHQILLSKQYYAQMERVYEQDRDCIRTLNFNEKKSRYIASGANKACEDGLFPILLYGYKEHMKVIKETGNVSLLNQKVNAACELTGNQALAPELSR